MREDSQTSAWFLKRCNSSDYSHIYLVAFATFSLIIMTIKIYVKKSLLDFGGTVISPGHHSGRGYANKEPLKWLTDQGLNHFTDDWNCGYESFPETDELWFGGGLQVKYFYEFADDVIANTFILTFGGSITPPEMI